MVRVKTEILSFFATKSTEVDIPYQLCMNLLEPLVLGEFRMNYTMHCPIILYVVTFILVLVRENGGKSARFTLFPERKEKHSLVKV